MNKNFDDDFLDGIENGEPVSLSETTPQVFRPAFDALESGTYKARILHADFSKVNEQLKLKITAEFFIEDDETLVETCQTWLNWKPGSPCRCFLEATDALPQPKTPLQFDRVIGKEVLLTVKINERNGNSYVNLVMAEAITN